MKTICLHVVPCKRLRTDDGRMVNRVHVFSCYGQLVAEIYSNIDFTQLIGKTLPTPARTRVIPRDAITAAEANEFAILESFVKENCDTIHLAFDYNYNATGSFIILSDESAVKEWCVKTRNTVPNIHSMLYGPMRIPIEATLDECKHITMIGLLPDEDETACSESKTGE